MASTVNTTIDPNGGGDYTTFAAWIAAKTGSNLVSLDEVWQVKVKKGDSGELDLSGDDFTTDATRYVNIYADESASEKWDEDTPLDPDTDVANVASIDGAGIAAQLGTEYIFLDGLLMISEASTANGDAGAGVGNSSNGKFTDCLLVQRCTDGNEDALGFYTGTGFAGRIVNCLSIIEDDTGYDSVARGYDVDCSAAREALINCTVINQWNDAGFLGVRLKNSAYAVNVLSASQYAVGDCFDDDGNGNAYVKYCAATDTSITDEFDEDNIVGEQNVVTYSTLFSALGVTAGDAPIRKQGRQSNYSSVDPFDTPRVLPDIGYYQTLLVTSEDLETIFRDMGLIIRGSNYLTEVMTDLVEVAASSYSSQIDSDMRRLTVMADALKRYSQEVSQLKNWSASHKQILDSYLTTFVLPFTMDAGTTTTDAIDAIDYWLGVNSDDVNAIDVTYNVEVDPANTGDDLSLASVTIPEALEPQKIELECINATTSGSESWSVRGSEYGSFGSNATTDVAYSHTQTGLAFTIESDGVDPAVGDKIYLSVTADEAATYQIYFRDRYAKCFENSVSDGTNTIDDGWAE